MNDNTYLHRDSILTFDALYYQNYKVKNKGNKYLAIHRNVSIAGSGTDRAERVGSEYHANTTFSCIL